MEYTVEDADAGDRLLVVGTSALLAGAGFVVPLLLALVVLSVLAGFGVVITTTSAPVVAYPTLTIIQGAGFGLTVAVFLYVSDYGGLLRARLPSLRGVAAGIAGLVALFVGVAGVSAIYAQLDVATAQNQIVEIGRQNPEVMLYMIPLAVLVIGPGEELLFRGAIQGVLRRVYAPVPGVLLASVFFALAHITALQGAATVGAKAATLTAIFVLSLVLGAVYEYTDNLVVPALVHGLYDAILFAAIYLQATMA